VTALEAALADAEARAAAADAEAGALEAARADAAAARAAAGEAAARAGTAEAAADAAAADAAAVTARLGRGEYNPDAARVLHLVRNPEAAAARADAAARVAAAEAEAAALRAELGAARGQGGGGAPSSPAAATAAAITAAADARVADADKRAARLQAAFAAQAAAYRRATERLLGWRRDMAPPAPGAGGGPTYALRPALGGDQGRPGEVLTFRDGSPATASAPHPPPPALVPNEWARSRSREVDTYVTGMGSVPALVAALTLELIQREADGGEGE
jgi:hypothetical protein